MIGIKEIASYIPKDYKDNLKQKLNHPDYKNFITQKIGVEKTTFIKKNKTSLDMAEEAIKSLLKKTSIDIHNIQCIVVVTQTPHAEGLPHTSAYLHEKLKLKSNVACFDVSLGCSGYVYGLNIISGFMQASGLNQGILITSDPYSKIIDPKDKSTALLFGDAATATLISDKPKYKILNSVFNTDGSNLNALIKKNGKFKMDGRKVFNFSATEVPKQIYKLLKLSNISIDDIDLFIFHQGSRFMVETISKRMKLDINKTPINIKNFGNTVSSSIPLVLEDYLNDNLDRIILSGFGVGLSWGSIILERYSE